MAGYVSLPAYQVPRNAMLDFSGLNAGIDAIAERNQNAMNRAERAEERTYQRGRNAMSDARHAQERTDLLEDRTYQRGRQAATDAREQTRFANEQTDRTRKNYSETVKSVAGFIQQNVIPEKDPARRKQLMDQLFDSHPDLKNAPDAFRDPTSGPELFVSQARGYMDPLERQSKETDIEYKRAMTQKALQPEVTKPPSGYRWAPDGQAMEPIPGGPAVVDQLDNLSPGQKRVDQTFAKSYEDFVLSGGAADYDKNVAQLKGVHTEIKEPKAGANYSGPILGRMPDAITAYTNPKAVDLRQQVEEIVQRNLRIVLGAQFTQKEGENLIARAYNPALDEKTNAARLERLISSMEKMKAAKMKAMDYFEQHGTMKGFRGTTQFSVDDIANDLDAPTQPEIDGRWGIQRVD